MIVEKLRRSAGIALSCRLFLGLIFLVSALGKMVDIEKYSVTAVYAFGVLPLALARPFGLVMPFIELALAICLLSGIFTRLSAIGAMLLSISFLTAKLIVLSQGEDIACGCFGAVIDTLASMTLYMDAIMIIMGLALALSLPEARHRWSVGALLSSALRERLRTIW
jgi:uncharacterized membrane protein YphA (DoxX/SURF4 family)